MCRDVLAPLKLGHCVIRQPSEQGVVQVRRNKCMDNLLAGFAVKESPGFANVSDMVAGRLTERIYVGDHGHVHVKHCTQVPDRCRRCDQRRANSHTRNGDLRYNCCRDRISSTSVLPSFSFRKLHPGTDVMTAFFKSTSGPINVGLDRLHKHMGVIRVKVVVKTISTDNPTEG